MQKRCYCGGSNEQCAFCFGSGVMYVAGAKWYDPSLDSARPRHITPEAKCKRCAFVGSAPDLRRHWNQVHLTFDERLAAARREIAFDQARSHPAEQLPILSKSAQVRCIFCKQTLDPDAYDKHRPCPLAPRGVKLPLLLRHPNKRDHSGKKGNRVVQGDVGKAKKCTNESKGAKREILVDGPSRRPLLKTCPLCGCQIRGNRLQGHMTTRCPRRRNEPIPLHAKGRLVQHLAPEFQSVISWGKELLQRNKAIKANRKENGGKMAGGNGKQALELSSEEMEMQKIFESKMLSAGRFGSSRKH